MHGILYIIDNYKDPYAGTEGQLFQLVKGLDRSRFKPKLILFQPSKYIEQEGFPCEVEILQIQKLVSPRSWARLWRLAKRAQREGYDLAQIFFNDPSLAAPFFLKVHGFKVLVSRRDMGFWHNWLNLALLRMNRFFVDGVVANSEAVKQVTHIRERFPLHDIHVIANGYPATKAFSPSPCPPELAELAQSGECIAGLVANIRPIKRIQDAIEAIAAARRQNCFVSLVIIGGGDSAPLERLAEERGVRPHVLFLGTRNDVERFVPFFSVGLLCSESEGFSNSVIEYLRAGIPVICTAAGGNLEVIRDDENGYLYAVGDVKELTRLLEKLARDAALRNRLGQGAAASAGEYTIERMLDAHANLYSRLLGDLRDSAAGTPSAPTGKRETWAAKGNH